MVPTRRDVNLKEAFCVRFVAFLCAAYYVNASTEGRLMEQLRHVVKFSDALVCLHLAVLFLSLIHSFILGDEG